MAKPFASSADLGPKEQTLEVLADGVYALTAEGDPNIGAVEGEDFVVCFEALATPVAAATIVSVVGFGMLAQASLKIYRLVRLGAPDHTRGGAVKARSETSWTTQ